MKALVRLLTLPGTVLAMLLLFAAASCQAGGCRTDDAWRGRDKQLHAAGGALVAAGVTAYTGDWRDGVLSGFVLGFAKEAADARSGRTCTLQDALVTGLGGLAGAGLAGLVIQYRADRTVVVAYRWEVR